MKLYLCENPGGDGAEASIEGCRRRLAYEGFSGPDVLCGGGKAVTACKEVIDLGDCAALERLEMPAACRR